MKILNLLSCRGLTVVLIVWTGCVFSGCQSAEIEQLPSEPVFFPPPPEKPRLQFLKSFSGAEDLESKVSAFERFIVGEPELEEGIAKPYGVAIFEGKLYVCDVLKRVVEVLDLEKGTFGYLTRERRMMNPVNIYIDSDGTKYIADPTGGAVFVFDKSDNLKAILGKELDIKPVDVVVRQQKCFIADAANNQVIILDKVTGKEITRIGTEGGGDGQFISITGLALDKQNNVYTTDKIKAQITKFNESGIFQQVIGQLDTAIGAFVRPKGIAVDKEGRIWVVDAAPEVAKIYNPEGQLLLFFGLPDESRRPGTLTLPAAITIDYDNVELFRKYAVEGANIEFLVLVSSQYGPNKINVYGFGSFPEQEQQKTEQRP